MSMLCRIGFHSWLLCTCQRCGRTRDKNHDWENFCKCRRCGQIRPWWETRYEAEWHDWVGCKCRRCGSTRDSGHSKKAGSCVCVICGTKSHEWGRSLRDNCKHCGESNPDFHGGGPSGVV